MTKFFNKSKKIQFAPFLIQFPDFGEQCFLPKKSTLTFTNSFGLDRRTDNQILFHDTLLITIRGPTDEHFQRLYRLSSFNLLIRTTSISNIDGVFGFQLGQGFLHEPRQVIVCFPQKNCPKGCFSWVWQRSFLHKKGASETITSFLMK